MARTHRWAERSLAAAGGGSQAVFGIIQGGVDPELRRESAAAIAGLAFDGIAIGGLSVGESKAEMASTLEVVAEASGDDPRPRYLMGVGSPLTSSSPSSTASISSTACCPRVSRARARSGPMRAGSTSAMPRFLDDPEPIDPACACEACRNHSRAYLAHLFRARELLAYRLATVHNVTWTLELMRRLRSSLADGSFEALRGRIGTAFGPARGSQ